MVSCIKTEGRSHMAASLAFYNRHRKNGETSTLYAIHLGGIKVKKPLIKTFNRNKA